MLGKFPTQTELDIHIGSIHRKIPFSSCSCYGDVQESRMDSCDSCDNNGKMVTVYISTEQSLQVLATYVGRNLRLKLKWTHTWGRYMERLFPPVVLGMIMPLLQVVYVLPMTRLRLICDIYCDVCDSISQVRDGLGSHMRAMNVKKHNQFCRKEWFLGIMFWRKESETLVQEKWWVDLLWNFMKLIILTCDECNYKFELQSSLRRHERFGHKGEN